MSSISPGQSVPEFSALSTNSATFNLSAYRGHYVVVYFYPKDNTPGCTVEAQAFRDAQPAFAALNCVLVGISRDSLKSHENFKAKHQLSFELLSDADETLCQLFDVIKQKNMYGKQVRGIERSTFLIDPHGVLLQEWRQVKVKEHVDSVLQTLKNAVAQAAV